MKKTASIFVAMLLVLALFAGVAENIGLPNPVTDYASLSEINEILACHLERPGVMGVTDELFRIITTGTEFDIGEYTFMLNGMFCCYRFCADYEIDASGVWIDGEPAFTGTALESEYAFDGTRKLIRWANTDGQYVFSMADEGALTDAQFVNMVEEIIATSMAPEADVDAKQANIVTEYASLSEVNDILGCSLQHPGVMGVTDESFCIITTEGSFDIGEYCFTLNGLNYSYRFCADYDIDASGLWIDGEPAFEGTVLDPEYAYDAKVKVIRWANTLGQYTFCVYDDGVMTADQFVNIVEEIMPFSMPTEG